MTGDRGRIPFALVGVLLLVSSATIAATNQPAAAPTEPAVSKAMDRATAESQTAIRSAAMEASRDAARSPVVERANTTAGRALNESTPFRDALRIRIYLAARERLDAIDRRRGGVRVTASLPSVEDASRLRRAKRRVHVARADENGTTMRVRIENVSVTATRNGRALTERHFSPTFVVGSPALALHDRVSAYQRKLDAGVTEPGLSQRLTAQLYALTWARGYAQYAGGPIENVVNNRHVGIATNAGLLDVQRATFGESDPDGRRTLALATAKAAGSELLRTTGTSAPTVQRAFDSPTKAPPNDVSGLEPPAGTRRNDEMTVGVNGTADDALLNLVRGGGLNRTIRTVYSADVRLVTDVETSSAGSLDGPTSPGDDWTLVSSERETDTAVSSGAVEPPATPSGWHRFEAYARDVSITRERTRTWRKGNETETRTARATTRKEVVVAVVGRHETSESAPDGRIRTVHERGAGPLDGPNLADVRNRALRRLVVQRGGRDEVVERAATETLDTGTVRIRASQPDGVYRWTYRDLMTVRERIRSVSVDVDRGKVGTFERNPPSMFAERIRDRRAELVDAPPSYDSVATRARFAARAAYVDAVLARLDDRATQRRERERGFGDALRQRNAGSLAEVRAGERAARGGSPPFRPSLEGAAGPVRLRVDSAPSYLTRAEVTPERVPALDGPGHPLVARNVNLFTVPYGDATDAVVDSLLGSGGTVHLATAARTLRAANATLEREPTSEVRTRRDALRAEVTMAQRHVRVALRDELAERGVGNSPSERWDVVSAGMDRWGGRGAQALALSNGSAAESVATAAADHESLDAVGRDRLELALEARTEEALADEQARPEVKTVNRTRTATRTVAATVTKQIATDLAKRGVGRAANRSFDRVPSGLPLALPVSSWYVTTNAWHVTVRGEYARFGVRANRGRPSAPGAGVTYVRDGSAVSLDVDGDEEAERLGTATKVDFDVSTTVVVVVPPGKSGVGDRDGNADEKSEGWPEPGA